MSNEKPVFLFGRMNDLAGQSPEAKKTVQVYVAVDALAQHIGPEVGLGPLMGGIMSQWIMLAHRHGVHAQAVSWLKASIAQLEQPEVLEAQMTSHGRA